MSRFEENRLFVLNDSHAPRLSPALAQEIGLNESILFLQLEFLLAVHGSQVAGRRWVRMSVRDLEREFPFWSYSTINRAVQSLESRRLIEVQNFNRRSYDKTRWFSINLGEAARLRSIAVKPAREGGEVVRPVGPAPETSDAEHGGGETRSTQNETGSLQDETGSTQFETAIDREIIPETKPENTHTPAPGGAITPEGGRAGPEAEGGVCVSPGSTAYSPGQRKSYALAHPLSIKTPEQWVWSKRTCAGEFDDAIRDWYRQGRPVEGGAATARPADTSACPDCRGSGHYFEDPKRPETHRRCTHPRLAESRAGPARPSDDTLSLSRPGAPAILTSTPPKGR